MSELFLSLHTHKTLFPCIRALSLVCRICFQAVRDDLGLQRLVLETCRGHLRALRTSTAAATAGLMVEIGGSCSAKGAVSASSALGGIHGGPQDEADAARAGKAAVKRCTGLAPLLLKEVIRQVRNGKRLWCRSRRRTTASSSFFFSPQEGFTYAAKAVAPSLICSFLQ